MPLFPRLVKILLGLALSATGCLAETPPKPIILGYYPSWETGLPIEKIDYSQFTHLIHAFATLRKGVVHTEGNLPSAALTAAAHKAGVKVLLGVGGADSGGSFSALVRDPALQDACIQTLVKLVTDNGYDGLDIDWEYPRRSEVQQTVDFVAKVRQALQDKVPGALVTMPVPAFEYYGQNFDGPKLAPLLDFINIMTYDFHGPWKEGHGYMHAGFIAPLNETDTDPVDGHNLTFQKSVGYWRSRGFSNQQILVGIPFFGLGFMVKNWGEVPLTLPTHGEMNYRNLDTFLKAGWQKHWDNQAGVPWLQSPPNLPAELISYEDPQSVALKAQWARQTGLRGIFFWEISQDFLDGHNPLVQSARQAFLSTVRALF